MSGLAWMFQQRRPNDEVIGAAAGWLAPVPRCAGAGRRACRPCGPVGVAGRERHPTRRTQRCASSSCRCRHAAPLLLGDVIAGTGDKRDVGVDTPTDILLRCFPGMPHRPVVPAKETCEAARMPSNRCAEGHFDEGLMALGLNSPVLLTESSHLQRSAAALVGPFPGWWFRPQPVPRRSRVPMLTQGEDEDTFAGQSMSSCTSSPRNL